MTSSVLLIGFQDQDNLGLRYLLSSVRHAGFRGEIATYTADPAPICQWWRGASPMSSDSR
jgi:hypothetical protein